MNLIPVKSIPKASHKPKLIPLADLLEDFVRSPSKIAKVDYRNDEYANPKSCVDSIRLMIRYHGFPVRAVTRGDDIYLKKEN